MIIIFAMKESENKAIGFIGIGIILVAKYYGGIENVSSRGWILILLGVIVIIGLAMQYNKVKNFNEDLDMMGKINKKHSLTEIREIVHWETELRYRVAEAQILRNRQEINEIEYINRLGDIVEDRKKLQVRYNATEEEIQEYYSFSRSS